MKQWIKKTGKSIVSIIYLTLGLFFFYIDFFIFKYVLWPSFKEGSLQLHEDLNIYIFSFTGNMAYIPFLVYLTLGLLFIYLMIKILYRTFITS